MSDSPERPDFAPEQYELNRGPAYRFELNRREFFKQVGGGLAVICLVREGLAAQANSGLAGPGEPPTESVGSWLHLAENGTVTVYTGKVEVGQNIRTSLAQGVAEELRLPMDSIEMVMGDTDRVPFDRGTFGSRSTPDMGPRLRRAAAVAREVLVGLAAQAWGTEAAALLVADGRVSDPRSGRSFGFAELSRGQKLVQAIPADTPLTAPHRWKVLGTSVPKVNGRSFVTGAHRYVSDLQLPGLLHGKVLRPPALGAVLLKADTSSAEAIPGVTVVRDAGFIGVAAADSSAALQALAAIRAEWKAEPQPSRGELFDYLKRNAAADSRGLRQSGEPERGLAEATQRLSETYTIDYIAHVPLEPRAAVAQWEGDRLTVWTGTQRPFGVRAELARAFHMPEERIRVLMPDTGSGYGGKHTGEAALEAARLARAAGRPVKLVWTREEEFNWAYFRPAGLIEVNSGLSADGKLIAWDFHNYNSGGSGIGTPYEVPHQRVQFHASQSPLRQGSYRALASTANHFARESHMDDLAALAEVSPLEFRLRHLRDERMVAVLRAAAQAFGWKQARLPAGHGMGLAVGTEKGGVVATCAEVAIDSAYLEVRVVRVVTAFECGGIVNPEHLKSQVEGCVIQGIGGALFEAVDFAGGHILNGSFSSYRVPRFRDAPLLEIVLLNRPDIPSAGAGEAPIIAIAPAIGNAIRQATGIRLRSLPLAPHGLMRG